MIKSYNLIYHPRLHEKLHEEDQAASAYTDYINEATRQGVNTSTSNTITLDIMF